MRFNKFRLNCDFLNNSMDLAVVEQTTQNPKFYNLNLTPLAMKSGHSGKKGCQNTKNGKEGEKDSFDESVLLH